MPHKPFHDDERMLLIADDLTGAGDAGVAFAARGLRTQVVLEGEAAEDTVVTAISTESRDVDRETVRQRLHDVAAGARRHGFMRICKKIDSVFRGNTAQEIAATVEIFHADLTVIAPAYPALGRTSVEGVLHIRDFAGKRTHPALAELREHGLTPCRIALGRSALDVSAAMRDAVYRGCRVVYCDAVTQTDLEHLVEAAEHVAQQVLWVGSAGIAHALAAKVPARIAPREPVVAGAVLIFAGSDHPVTLAQLRALDAHAGTTAWEWERAACGTQAPRTVIFQVARTMSTQTIRSAVETIHQPIACMVMTGGDTASLVCRSLGIRALDLEMEFAPGLPQGIAVGGPWTGCRVVLKSGGFGEAEVLCRIVEHFGTKEERLVP